MFMAGWPACEVGVAEPRLVVFSTLFPHPGQPNAGVFIRERMFRVGKVLPLTVVAPVPWFPLQSVIRKWRPHFRPAAPRMEMQDGIEVLHPRFFSVPGLFKQFDGFFMALGSLPTLLRLRKRFAFNLIDAHFAFPDGYAATLLGRWLKVPVTITLRGTEVPHSRDAARRRRIAAALARARRVFSVSDSLKQHAVSLGADGTKIRVVGNGVDTAKFHPVAKTEARAALGLPIDAPVLISVGGLVERKGFHRVIECLPSLLGEFPGLRYLIVGGANPEGDWSGKLQQQVAQLGLQNHVLFLGAMPSAELKRPLSAADVFVLATRNEGWANVFLEAMACGLPVITTDVGGNAEVVCEPVLGAIVPFGDAAALQQAIANALRQSWDRAAIMAYALTNSWDSRVAILTEEFTALVAASQTTAEEVRLADV
jgi:teichuronic acid biosynthesis glycosyltransferase TuaC